jgi:hypothetical protein
MADLGRSGSHPNLGIDDIDAGCTALTEALA